LKIKTFLLVTFIVFFTHTAWTQSTEIDEEHRQLALELLKSLKIDQQTQKQLDQVKEFQQGIFNDLGLNNNAFTVDMMDDHDEMWKRMSEQLSWENMKNDYINVYAEVFTKEELKGLTEFFNSPIGAAYGEKTPELSMKLMNMATKNFNFQGLMDEAKKNTNDALTKVKLRSLAMASEAYATVNYGQYPTNILSLTNANPPFVKENYCDKSDSGFVYTCEMTENTYQFTAIPVEIGVTGTTTYTITTGAILTPNN